MIKINLYGEIVSDDWVWLYDFFGLPCCSPKTIRDAMQDLAPDDTLVVEINSPGGDVFAGFEMYGLLQSLRGRTEAHIIAKAASAATTVMCACETVLASPVAQIMIHQPAAMVYGYYNNEDTERLKNFLDSVKASILNGYTIKCAGKSTRRALEKAMDAETYMPVQEAMDLGLVDGLLDADDGALQLLTSHPVQSPVEIMNAAGGLTPMALLEQYRADVRAGIVDPAPGHPVAPEAPKPAASVDVEEDPAPIGTGIRREDIVPDADIIPAKVVIDRDAWKMQAAIDLERAKVIA